MYEVFNADGKFVYATNSIIGAMELAKIIKGYFNENPDLRKERY